jgi:aminopeptidase YwaD
MKTERLFQKSLTYLQKLCNEIPDRSVGNEGNRIATNFFKIKISSFGWDTEIQEFEAIDWKYGAASLQADGSSFEVFVSPYSLGCETEEQLISVSSIEELEQTDIKGKIVLLYGEIAKEQLMPKNFVFYNPEKHQQIISLLEKGEPRAIICATGRNPSLAGGVYPFPLIEDGDFDIPSVYMTEDEGSKLLPYVGKTVVLKSISRRIPGKGYNVIARKGKQLNGRIVITAHIDAKKGTPGAIDNATGVVVLLLLADLLEDYDGSKLIEIVAFNGEDYYAVPGQMLYINQNQDRFNEILLNINIDGAGYKEGKSVFSFYGLPEEIKNNAKDVLSKFDGITEGVQWPQGDHSIFIQYGRPAIAVSSKWFTENIDSQEITHTPKDNIEIVDCQKVVEIAQALNLFIRK